MRPCVWFFFYLQPHREGFCYERKQCFPKATYVVEFTSVDQPKSSKEWCEARITKRFTTEAGRPVVKASRIKLPVDRLLRRLAKTGCRVTSKDWTVRINGRILEGRVELAA